MKMGLVDRLSEGGRDREGDDVGDGSADEEEEEEVTPRRVARGLSGAKLYAAAAFAAISSNQNAIFLRAAAAVMVMMNVRFSRRRRLIGLPSHHHFLSPSISRIHCFDKILSRLASGLTPSHLHSPHQTDRDHVHENHITRRRAAPRWNEQGSWMTEIGENPVPVSFVLLTPFVTARSISPRPSSSRSSPPTFKISPLLASRVFFRWRRRRACFPEKV